MKISITSTFYLNLSTLLYYLFNNYKYIVYFFGLQISKQYYKRFHFFFLYL